MRYFLYSLFFLFISLSAISQISHGGVPPSFGTQLELRSKLIAKSIMPTFDLKKLKSEDLINEELGLPLRVAEIIPYSLNFSDEAEWETLKDGTKIKRVTIASPNAIAMILYYHDFQIPQGGKLYIYNKDRSHILGAYTSETNGNGKTFATEPIIGDYLTLEYVSPQGQDISENPTIRINGIGYCYNNIQVFNQNTLRVNESSSCQVNINCSEGRQWQHQKKGVARTITPIGKFAYLCSGTLVNTTEDEIIGPYYLSAHHCFYDDLDVQANFNEMIFYFHYEFPDCDNLTITPSTTKTMVGAQLLVDIDVIKGSDGALLKLNQDIPTSYNVFYNGWDISREAPLQGVGIHHPKGDAKKISTYIKPATSSTWWDGQNLGASGAHWNVIFAATEHGHSVTEGGSSGSPLFNQNGLVVGTLTGGSSTCILRNGNNLYGKLDQHWDQYTQKMKDYLDPKNTGLTKIEGRYYEDKMGLDFSSDKTDIFTGDSISFANLSYGGNNYEWVFEGGETNSTSDKYPIVYYKKEGVYPVEIYANKGLSTERHLVRKDYISVVIRPGTLKEASLIGTIVDNKIRLDWDRYESDNHKEREVSKLMRWDDGIPLYTTKLLKNGTYEVLSKWTSDDLYQYQSINLKGVSFNVNDSAAKYSVVVIQNGKTLLSQQVESISTEQANFVKFPQVLAINPNEDLLVGYKVTHEAGSSPILYDGGPIEKGKNLVRFNESTIYTAEAYKVVGNWSIATEIEAILKPDFTHNVFRNGTLLAAGIDSLHYIDKQPDYSISPNTYQVSTTFLLRTDSSSLSNIITIELPDQGRTPFKLTFNQESKTLEVIPFSPLESIHVYDGKGKLQYRYQPVGNTPYSIDVNGWAKENLYILQIMIGNKAYGVKVLIQ